MPTLRSEVPMQPRSEAQRHAMYGYAKGSIADRMTNEQRKAFKRWLTETSIDGKVMEAQLAHGAVSRARSIKET
jgi:hypothetical protein